MLRTAAVLSVLALGASAKEPEYVDAPEDQYQKSELDAMSQVAWGNTSAQYTTNTAGSAWKPTELETAHICDTTGHYRYGRPQTGAGRDHHRPI